MAREQGGRRDTVDAPLEEVVAALLDFERYPQWSSTFAQVRVLERDAEGRGALVAFAVDAKVRRVRYTSRYEYDLPHGFRWHMEHGDVKALRGGYTFAPLDAARTDVTVSIEFDVGFYVPGPVKKVIRDQALRTSVQELRAHLRG